MRVNAETKTKIEKFEKRNAKTFDNLENVKPLRGALADHFAEFAAFYFENKRAPQPFELAQRLGKTNALGSQVLAQLTARGFVFHDTPRYFITERGKRHARRIVKVRGRK